jgi:hypothetical protein
MTNLYGSSLDPAFAWRCWRKPLNISENDKCPSRIRTRRILCTSVVVSVGFRYINLHGCNIRYMRKIVLCWIQQQAVSKRDWSVCSVTPAVSTRTRVVSFMTSPLYIQGTSNRSPLEGDTVNLQRHFQRRAEEIIWPGLESRYGSSVNRLQTL